VLYSFSRFRSAELVDTFEGEYADDLAALDAARLLSTDHTVEVYENNRFVARIKRTNEPPTVRDGDHNGQSLTLLITDADKRVDAAFAELQKMVSHSEVSVAKDWELRARSGEALHRSRDTLARLNGHGRSALDLTARVKPAK
jgi:hypothetical protein